MSFQFTRRAVYGLKRSYALELDLYSPVSNSVDYITGVMGQTAKKVRIPHAIVLDARLERIFHYDRTFISAGTNFAYGAMFDKSFRKLVIDNAEIPSDFVIDVNCWVIFGGVRWEVKQVFNYEVAAATILVVQNLQGAPIGPQIYDENVVDSVKLTDTAG